MRKEDFGIRKGTKNQDQCESQGGIGWIIKLVFGEIEKSQCDLVEGTLTDSICSRKQSDLKSR